MAVAPSAALSLCGADRPGGRRRRRRADRTAAAQRFVIDQSTGALISGTFTPPPPPPPPPPPGKRHSTCAALVNHTSTVGGKVVTTHSNKQRCGVTLEECCALCDGDPKCNAFTLVRNRCPTPPTPLDGAAPSEASGAPCHQQYYILLER